MEIDLTGEESVAPEEVTLRAENIGGIDETEVTLHRGITALSGRNATNRTSLLQAIMAALGSDLPSMKTDAEEGFAELAIGDETYRRTFHRRNGTVTTDGDPYLEDAEIADLFAFLLHSNEARRAVVRGDDLRELIMRPVDTDAIQSEIERLERRKREIDEQLEELDELGNELPDLERKRSRLTAEIEELQEELATAEDELEEANASVEQQREGRAELEERLDELRSTRSKLERKRNRIETERESIDALETEREELEEQLDSFVEHDDERDRLQAEIDSLERKTEELGNEISQLQSTIQFNEELLEEPGKLAHVHEHDGSDGDEEVTDRLLAGSETVTCWTCGSSVPRDQIETTIEQLRKTRQERLEERNELRSELKERRRRVSEIEENREQYERAKRRRRSVENEIEQRTERLETLTTEREELLETVSELENEIQNLESDTYSEVLDRHREANQLEFELERTENERAEVEERIASIEDRLDDRDDLQERREDVADRLTELRTRIERIEGDAVEAFNQHMENVLEVLGYENIDRIWIDRTTREVREGRRTVTKSTFELKIVRSTDEGSAFEDSIGNLSESEREVTGLVFALAGYLVHDVYETVPFMVLDSLEAIDSNRIAALVDYFESYVPYLVVALLEEDAQALDMPHETVTEI